ncbi:MAG: sensor domain-containing diguanylate cyclase [Rhodospirillales bacterium]|nr:sensor domain-containing diguanylate cyclase [Rhodospirillales bacterium]
MNTQNSIATESKKSFAKAFLILFIPFSLALILIVAPYHRLTAEKHENELLMKEEARLELVKDTASRLFRTVITDLLVLSENENLMRVLRNPRKLSYRARVAREFALFSRRKASYDQIRYIDENGKEVVRVDFKDGDPSITPSTQLQDKSKRYYFKATKHLNKTEIYVSPMDLNVENNRIVKPFKPMIRFITPVFDRSGLRRGIIVLNYYGSDFLEQFDALLGNRVGRPMLINIDGNMLHGGHQNANWGEMLGQGRNFANVNLAAWEYFLQRNQGWLEQSEGTYIFTTSYPLFDALKLNKRRKGLHVPAPYNKRADEYAWKVVTFVPKNILRISRGENSFIFMILYVACVIISAFASRSIVGYRFRRQRTEDMLRQLATRDVLTGLWNRRSLFEHGEETLKHSEKSGSIFSVIMLDVDHFKAVNDTYGHAAGDMVLKELSSRLFDAVRSVDIAARYGGEEFTVLSPRTDLQGALLLAERIRAAVSASPFDIGDQTICITVSLGVAKLVPGEDTFQSLVNKADQSLYDAKNSGRNCVSYSGIELPK